MLEQNPLVDNIALSILLPKLHADLLELLAVLMTMYCYLRIIIFGLYTSCLNYF